MRTGLTGAVVDRATGCYALLKASNRPSWSYVGMFGDSLVTLEGSRQPTTMIVDGKPRRVSVAEDSHIFRASQFGPYRAIPVLSVASFDGARLRGLGQAGSSPRVGCRLPLRSRVVAGRATPTTGG